MRKITLIAVPLVALTVACGVGSTAAKHGASGPSHTSAAGVGAEATAPATSTKTTPAAKPAGPKTVMTAHGSGIKKTAKFTTGADWTIHWSYDCSSFGLGKGNFAVMVYTDGALDDVAVNELGKKGSDTAPEYDDPGTHYLEVNSECSWTLKVMTP